MPSSQHLRIEQAIANSHRSLTVARDEASTFSDLGLHDDLQMILVELERLQVDLLRSTSRKRTLSPPQPVSQNRRI